MTISTSANGAVRRTPDKRPVARLRGALVLLCAWALVATPATHALAQSATATITATPPTAPTAPTTPTAPPSRDANVRQVVLGIVSYTRWPVTPPKVRLCVVGTPDYARDLLAAPLPASVAPIEAQRLAAGDPALGTRCDVVYLGAMSDPERKQLYAGLAGHPVLTISERNDSCTLGAMFCLNVDAERVTFDINLDTVARSGVRVHPNVLKLARKPGTP